MYEATANQYAIPSGKEAGRVGPATNGMCAARSPAVIQMKRSDGLAIVTVCNENGKQLWWSVVRL